MFQSQNQRGKKVVSDRPRLVDFAIGLVNSVFYLPNGQVIFWGKFKLQNNKSILLIKIFFFRLVKMTFEVVHGNNSLPEW